MLALNSNMGRTNLTRVGNVNRLFVTKWNKIIWIDTYVLINLTDTSITVLTWDFSLLLGCWKLLALRSQAYDGAQHPWHNSLSAETPISWQARGLPWQTRAFVHSFQPISASAQSCSSVCRCSPWECAGPRLSRVSLLHLPQLFLGIVSFLSFSNYPSVKVLDSVFCIKSQENLLQFDKSRVSGAAWYVSYCVIEKDLT